MPLAQIDNAGTQIFYEDSGEPANLPNYTTIVIVHGLIVNGATFARLLPVAAQHGLRIITMNNRDYTGSTPYTDAELAEFVSADTEVQAAAVRRWGHEIASFIRVVCETLGVPATVGGAGGVVLVAEALSVIAALALLGDARTLDPELRTAIAPFLRSVVLFDPPGFVFGARADAALTFPVPDASVPLAAKADAFIAWCSAHYAPAGALADATPEVLSSRDSTPLPRPRTFSELDDGKRARLVDPGVLLRSALVMATADAIRVGHARRALLDADAVLPSVDVRCLWCDKSPWITLWGAQVFEGFVKEEPEPAKRKRAMNLVKVENANHFVHWEEPERLVKLLAQL